MRLLILLTLLILPFIAWAQTSPDGTRVPPATQIVDNTGAVWKIGNKRPGAPATDGIPVKEMVYCRGSVYALNSSNGQWYRGQTSAGWTLVGTTDPCK